MADSLYEGAVNDLTDMSEFTEPTEDAENTGADEAEVQETEVETETQETTEPADTADEQYEEEQTEEDIPQGKRSRDSAFAEMRRAREEAERQNSELQERLEALERAQREAELRSYAESLGFSDDELMAQNGIKYEKKEAVAFKALNNSASAVFIMAYPKMKDILNISSQGYRMPQKSTYFYPKLLSGIVINQIK